MTTHKIHDIVTLKTSIKANAAETRAKREEARKLSGMDRWYAQREAEYNAYNQRYLLIAYGYLRGKSISQMESPYSDPEEIPSSDGILRIARGVFNKGPDGVHEDPATAPVPEPKPTLWQKIKGTLGATNPDTVAKDDVDSMVGWDAFEDFVIEDISSWTSKVRTSHALRAAQKRVA